MKTHENDKQALRDRIDSLNEEIMGLQEGVEDNLQEELLRDLEEWIGDCFMYN